MCQIPRPHTWQSRFQFLLRLLKHVGCTAPTDCLVALADLEFVGCQSTEMRHFQFSVWNLDHQDYWSLRSE
jgi:hypothetical protein